MQINLKLELILISEFFGFSGMSNFSLLSYILSKSPLILSVTVEDACSISSKITIPPFSTAFNKNPFSHSINSSPGSFLFVGQYFPIRSERFNSSVHIQ